MAILKDTAPVYFPDENQIISKYIDVTKFLSLLSKKSLFFCRLDKLEDQFEGMVAKRNYEYRIRWHKETNHLMDKPFTDEEIVAQVEQMYEYDKKVKEVYCVCCWNKADKESAALWKIYSDFGKGIMIKSSVKNLIAAFENTSEKIRVSEIGYLDYNKDLMKDGNTFFPLIHKQNAYDYEGEIRLIHSVDFPQIGKTYDWSKEEIQEGKLLTVDLNLLIDEIIIGPFSPKWMIDLIIDLTDKYGLKKTISKSKLSYT
ncbi:MAG: hypothetical protein ABIN97_11270 [Ginsengibacter sp.]